MDPETLKNRGLEGIWELLGATLARKISQKLSWLILVNFGQARIDQNLAQVENRTTVWLEAPGEYFGRSWQQIGLSWAILASSWELLGDMLELRWPKMAEDGQVKSKK